MQHNITLPEDMYNDVRLYLGTKHKTTYAAGDTLTVTLEGQREQKVFTIVYVLAKGNKVKQHWCILLLYEDTDHS